MINNNFERLGIPFGSALRDYNNYKRLKNKNSLKILSE